MRETRTPTENISSASRIVLRVAIIAKSDSSIYALALHKLGVEPESALRKANEKFTGRFTAMEERITASGRQMRDMTLDALENEWQRTKAPASGL